MKNILSFILFISVFINLTSCTEGFSETNTDPNIVTKPNVNFLLSYAQEKMVTYQNNEWIWESFEHLMLNSQYISSSAYELTNNVNLRYGNFYKEVLPNLVEIRSQIANMSNKESYKNIVAITYILQVLNGLKVTDMCGSIPYTEAGLGRDSNKFNPKYDNQKELFETFLNQLNEAITTLKNSSNQVTIGNADIYYKGDSNKWIKLANTIKLRIAARVENNDKTWAKSIFNQVLTDNIGPLNQNDDLTYSSFQYLPFGTSGDINYRAPRYASTSFIQFLKNNSDPRLTIYFEKNDLQGDFKDQLTQNNKTLPAFIDINDPLIAYQGAPTDWSTDNTRAQFISNPFDVGNGKKYFLISRINRKFFSPRMNNLQGTYKEIIVSYAETCFLMAEFLEKGYAETNPNISAETWYNNGIKASILQMNDIATLANSVTAFNTPQEAQNLITNYINLPDIKWGNNNLEKIYIQHYIHLFRQPNEGFTQIRRTGYPKNNSTYYPREPFNKYIPRRFWTVDPGIENHDNWMNSQKDQNFTPLSQDPQILQTERIWYDKSAPDFGNGL